MVNSIEDFKGLVAQRKGIATNNLFRVKLPSLPGATSSELNILCKDVQLPGRQIITNERRIGTKMEKVAYGYAINDISMTFHVLNDYGVKEYFETWQSLALNQDTYEIGYKHGAGGYAKRVQIEQLRKPERIPKYLKPRGYNTGALGGILPRLTDLDIVQDFYDIGRDLNDITVYRCTLTDAFPTSLNAIQLNNEQNGLTELNVTLSYTDWKPNSFLSPTNIKNAVRTGLGTLIGIYDL